MTMFGRYKINELSISRLLLAIKTRFLEIPHDFSWKFHAMSKINRKLLQKYKNIHSGERCFIVANGPSLTEINLELINQDISFGMNRIYLTFDSTSFRPDYYVAINELILEQFSSEIRKLKMPKFLNWNRRSFFTGPGADITYLKSKYVMNDFFQYDLTRPLVFGGTVTFVALQIAFYMGFGKVILVGLDHNYVDKGTPSKTQERKEEIDESHFHPQYFPKGVKWQLPDLLRSEIDYLLARRVYENDGRQILDATKGGKCQVFKKVDYMSCF